MKVKDLAGSILDQSDWLSRIAVAVVFGWFGVLKLLNVSPVAGLIHPLFERLAPFVAPWAVLLLGVGEVVLAVGFLVPKLTKWVVLLTVFHLIGTFLTLILTPELTWNNFLVPTFAGEFVVKNLVLIALSLNILQTYRFKQRAVQT